MDSELRGGSVDNGFAVLPISARKDADAGLAGKLRGSGQPRPLLFGGQSVRLTQALILRLRTRIYRCTYFGGDWRESI